jgi:GNAT superfamily N-acetyltransferase
MSKIKISKDLEIEIVFSSESNNSNQFRLLFQNQLVGYIDFEEYFDAYWYFEHYIDENQFNKLFPNSSFINMQLLFIRSQYRKKGFGNILMKKFLKYIEKSFPYMPVYLNASPFDNDIEPNISFENLVRFYESFHFIKIIKQEFNCQMVKVA